MQSVLDAISDRSIVLCAGPGGVGKTTSSAALGVAAAAAGKRVLVLTIDPAKRLADALGIGLDNEPKRIDETMLQAQGLEFKGELWAVMLDAARTFDDAIKRLAPTPQAADRLLNNVVYRQISRGMSGTLEYTAVEKLYDLRERFDFDLIVVDTPPSKNVLDFIEAPEWLQRFFDERVLKWFMMLDPKQPSGGFRRSILHRTGKLVSDVLGRVFGDEFVEQIVEFISAIAVMTAELSRRAQNIQRVLSSKESLFFVVTTTDRFVLNDAAFLRSAIVEKGIPFGGFIVNRTHPQSGVTDMQSAVGQVRTALRENPAALPLADKLVDVCHEIDQQAQRDFDAIHAFRRDTGWKGFLAMLPRQHHDVSDLKALHQLSAFLLEPERARAH